MALEIKRSAELSEDGVYRYTLGRSWDYMVPLLTFVMLNPSTADATLDDPTIVRCMGFARTLGCNGIHVVNLFAYRATDPKTMGKARRDGIDIVGPHNDRALSVIGAMAANFDMPVIAAWGARPTSLPADYFAARVAAVAALFPAGLQALALTRDGHPRHPLYLKADLTPSPWSPP